MSSFLTDEEIIALQDSNLSREVPFLITGISQGMFSFARYYGGMGYNSHHFIYLPLTDECISEDVHKWVMKRRKAATKAAKVKLAEEHRQLF